MRIPGSLALSLALLLLAAPSATGQTANADPQIGYLYPAGARQGTAVRVLAGGQNLRGLTGVLVTGEGVKGAVVRYMGRFTRLNGEERKALQKQLAELRKRPGGKGEDEPGAKKEAPAQPEAKQEADPVLEKLRKHPLLSVLSELTPEELEFVERKYLKTDPGLQPNAQIAETAMIEVTVNPGAPPGDRELRLLTPRGLTNPLRFQVGQLPERGEPLPADLRPGDSAPIEPPIVLNGQITPGDADQFRIRARQGQKLVIRVQARHLVPFLADAVPGWFQPVVTVRDRNGREIACADDWRFDPDPVVYLEVPAAGILRIEIRDALWRGRDDFVYRVSVGEQPFVTSWFPLGGREGERTVASVEGWNLGGAELGLDTRPGPGRIRQAALERGGALSNPIAYEVGELPEILEAEPNDAPGNAQAVTLPLTVNGRISKPGDRDRFRFEGRAGDRIVAEVVARRLLSPLDSLLRLTDASGRVIAWNDDAVYKKGYLHTDMGVLTHHADSILSAALPGDGAYFVEVADAQGQGGGEYAYRLRLGPPRPDFALCATPPSLNLQPGRSAGIGVYALRRDGFDGEIEVRLKDAPEGFTLEGGTIPSGCDSVRMTLTAPVRAPGEPFRLRLEGVARIAGRELRREAVPCGDEMQAFLWRHLVPREAMMVAVFGKGGGSRVERVGEGPVRIPLGGSALVRILTPNLPNLGQVELELSEAPPGITLAEVQVFPRVVQFRLHADEKAAAGLADNLIVHAFAVQAPRPAAGKAAKARRTLVGILPAIPVRVVKE